MKSVNSYDAAEYHNLPSLAQDGSALRWAGALTLLLLAIVQAVGQPSATVSECTEAALRSALAQGGAVSFACDGTLLLSNTVAITLDTVLDAGARHIVISGGNAVPVFYVSSNVIFGVANLTIANGLSTNGGGAILNDGGALNLLNTFVQSNGVLLANGPGSGMQGEGGGILNRGGILGATNCTFCGNVAYGPAGALANEGGLVSLESCLFAGNLATNAGGGPSQGGAVYNAGGQVVLEACGFTENSAVLAQGATNNAGAGGALYSDGSLSARRCTFVGNSVGAIRNAWSEGGAGLGGALCSLGVMEVTDSTFLSNSVAGAAGSWGEGSPYPPFHTTGGLPGGQAQGGALFNGGTGVVSDSTFAWNKATGGDGGSGGSGNDVEGGAGGPGGDGGAALGGAVFGGGVTAMVNCTLGWNEGLGGAGGSGGNGTAPYDWPQAIPPGGDGGSGGVGVGALWGQCFLTNCTVAFNSGTGGAAGDGGGGGPSGHAGSAGNSGGPVSGAMLVNTLLVSNLPTNGLTAAIIDTNYNLWADTAAGIIGPLADNGGPTLTMALLQGSPAIDAGDGAAAPSTDQRGAPRPVGAGADIGAYEAGAPGLITPPQDSIVAPLTTAQFSVLAVGAEPLFYQWFFNATNPVAGGQNPSLQLTNVQLSQAGQYTVVITNAYGAVTSPPAFLTVVPIPPMLTLSPTSQAVWIGTSVSFQVAADGGPPLSFQWLFDGTNALAGATNATLWLTNVQPEQAGGYSVVVTNTVGSVTSAIAALTLTPPVVTNSTEAALRAALAAGGTITFASSGTITLTGTVEIARDTILDGTGLDVTISGGNAVRVFSVDTNVHFTVIHLTIANGYGDFGAGIYNAGGQLTLEQCRLANNGAWGADAYSLTAPGNAGGGAVYNTGTLAANLCSFRGNSARGGVGHPAFVVSPWSPVAESGPGAPAGGGALFNAAVATISLTTFDSNWAAGGGGGQGVWAEVSISGAPTIFATGGAAGADGSGGAIYNSGQLTLSTSQCTGNAAFGGGGGMGGRAQGMGTGSGAAGGPGGASRGGALYDIGVAHIDSTTWAANTAAGGGGGLGGASSYGLGGDAGPGGSAYGGAIRSGAASLVNSTITGNTCAGGPGGDGGDAPAADGGNGGNGGNGDGGGVSGPCSLTNCTLVANSAIAGGGGGGGSGNPGYGGPPYGRSPEGRAGSNGSATGDGADSAAMANTLLVANVPFAGLTNGLIDTNHNLWMDTNSRVVGPLADNGGPTLTMALLPGSPAIGQADSAIAPPADQRGVPRPSGPADIGAYGHGYPPILEAAESPQGGVDISVNGRAGQACRLLASPDLVNWTAIATNDFSAGDTFLFHDAAGAGQTQKFYRAVMP